MISKKTLTFNLEIQNYNIRLVVDIFTSMHMYMISLWLQSPFLESLNL